LYLIKNHLIKIYDQISLGIISPKGDIILRFLIGFHFLRLQTGIRLLHDGGTFSGCDGMMVSAKSILQYFVGTLLPRFLFNGGTMLRLRCILLSRMIGTHLLIILRTDGTSLSLLGPLYVNVFTTFTKRNNFLICMLLTHGRVLNDFERAMISG